MLEILLIIHLCKKIGTKIRSRGGSPGGYQALLVLMWFGGEILGAILGGVFTAIINPHEEMFLLAYLFAIIGAVIGAATAFWIADRANPPQPAIEAFDAGGYFQPRPAEPTERNDPHGHFSPGNPSGRFPDDQYRTQGGR